MARRSSIDELPRELRELIGKLRTEDNLTIDEIMAVLSEKRGGDAGVSRSALGRKVKNIDQVGEAIRQSRAAASEIMGQLGDRPDNELGRFVGEMLQTIIMKVAMKAMENGEQPDIEIKDIRALCDGLYRVVSAQKTDTDRIMKVREEAARQAAAKVIDAAQAELKKNKQPGLSAEGINNLWQAAGLPPPKAVSA